MTTHLTFRGKVALRSLLLLLLALPGWAQTRLQLKWEVVENVFEGSADRGRSRAVFTLTNRDTRPLPAAGWALYFSGRRGALAGSVTGGVSIEHLSGDLFRLAPTADFQGLAPGETLRVEYLSAPITSRMTDAPAGPYLVFDEAPAKGYALRDFTVAPFQRPEQLAKGPRDPVSVVTPEALYAQNQAIRDIPAAALPPIFPTPVSLHWQQGRLSLTAMPTVSAQPLLKREAAQVTELLTPYFRKRPSQAPEPAVRLEVGPVEGQSSQEAYELTVDPKAGIRIRGNGPAGVFNGLQSLRGLLPLRPQPAKGLDLPALRVVDAPRFAYRGLHLDAARNFQRKATVLKVLDLMARYKLNKFHFHVTDDEGWRLEIPSLPELTAVGARRGHTVTSEDFLQAAYGSGPDLDNPYGSGFYSRAEYIEILRFARARQIEVIPELEMPGHARAAVKAMERRFRELEKAGDPEAARRYLLSDPADLSQYSSAQRYRDNVMNPAMDSTYAFIERVVTDLVALHQEAGVPLANLHMGGDEVPRGAWEKSPVCEAFLKEKGLGSVDDLWFVFYDRVSRILGQRGVRLSGWEEIGLRKSRPGEASRYVPNPDFVERGFRLYVWNNVLGFGDEDLAYRLANGGYEVVLSPASNLYFDLAYNKNPEEPGLNWGGYVDVDKAFDFIPFDYLRNAKVDRLGYPLDRSTLAAKERLTLDGQKNILGIQGCLWSETLNEEGRLDYLLIPKLLGLAERAWAPDPTWARETDAGKAEALYGEAWSLFVNAVGKRELPRLDAEGLRLRYRIPPPGLKVVGGRVHANIQLPGFDLRYTTDGSEPTVQSPLVQGPIQTKGLIQVAAFNRTGRKGHSSRVENR